MFDDGVGLGSQQIRHVDSDSDFDYVDVDVVEHMFYFDLFVPIHIHILHHLWKHICYFLSKTIRIRISVRLKI